MLPPALGALGKCSQVRGSPPPGGAMAPPPAINVCHTKKSLKGDLRATGAPALGALGRSSQARGSLGRSARGSPPPGGAMGAPPSTGVCHAKKRLEEDFSAMEAPALGALGKCISQELGSPPPVASPPASVCHTKEQCVLCHRECNAKVCDKCLLCLKSSLLDANLDAILRSSPGAGTISYCIDCTQLVRGAHEEHQGRTIPLRPCRKLWAAWDSGCESWSALFDGVQTEQMDDSDIERPFLLKPPPGERCEVCEDIVAPPTMYGTLVRHCTVECWLKSNGVETDLGWADALVQEDFGTEGVCEVRIQLVIHNSAQHAERL